MNKSLLKLLHEACGLKLLMAILISKITLAVLPVTVCVQQGPVLALTVWDSVTLQPCS